jgi:hypothetical protein
LVTGCCKPVQQLLRRTLVQQQVIAAYNPKRVLKHFVPAPPKIIKKVLKLFGAMQSLYNTASFALSLPRINVSVYF